MASAGRILIMPKGDWDEATEYESLDLVLHGGTSWLGKKPSKGIEPSEEGESVNYWHKMFDISAEAVGALSKKGGDLEGNLSFSGGRGVLYATDAFTFLEAKQKGVGYRHIKVANPTKPSEVNDWIVFVDGDATSHTNYRIYGEHNKELLKTYIEEVIAEYIAKN